MQITHEEARQLIQFNADEALNPEQKTLLSTHIETCFECRDYAAEIQEIENILLPMMKRQWNRRPLPLSISDLRVKKTANLSRNIVAMRKAIISFVFMALVFSVWQFTRSGQPLPGVSTVIASSVPTPFLEFTSTTSSSENCNFSHYIVQANDTLARIADRFSVAEEEIISLNHLKKETLNSGMTLMIPACNFTPTSTIWPTIASETLIPVIRSATSSPVPNGY